MSVEITKQGRDRLLAQLSDATTGFNARMALTAPDHGVTAFSIDFSPASITFFETSASPDELEDSRPMKYPLLCLYAATADNLNMQMSLLFSGPLAFVLDTWISFKKSGVPQNTEALISATEAAIAACLADPNQMGNFTGPVTFNRMFKASRGALEIGADGWRMLLRFSLVLQLDTD